MSPFLLAAGEASKLTFSDIVQCPSAWAILLAAIGLAVMLPQAVSLGSLFRSILLSRDASPRPVRYSKTIGGLLLVIALGLFGADLPWLANPVAQGVFWLMAGITLVAAIGCITAQSPVYSALWFALSLLGTSGLFFLDGAQFLAVATVVVYAGAIVVTFLFVLMLAQPEGHAAYDRITWGLFPRAISVFVAGAIVAMLTMLLGGLKDQAQVADREIKARQVVIAADAKLAAATDEPVTSGVNPDARGPVIKAASQTVANDVLNPNHMARLGGYLFTRHLVNIEVAGTLLLAALVGAVAIAIQGKQRDRVEEAITTGAGT